MSADPMSLRGQLPAEVVVGSGRWYSYRNFPVFSVAWLWRRSLLFSLLILAFTSLVVLGVGIALGAWFIAFQAGLHFATAFLVMAILGPALATAARHASLPLRGERMAVVAAIVIGVAAGYQADRWSSDYLGNVVRPLVEKPNRNVHVVVRRAPEPAVSPTRIVNLVLILSIYSLIGGGMALRSYFTEPTRLREARERREVQDLLQRVQMSDLRMAVLQAQVEPHFLFNTLASLRSLIRPDPARAEAMLDALADHLRATIPRLRADLASVDSTLGQQVDICASYLALMQVRMGSRLHVEIRVDDALRALPFPPLMLISLVENAMKHGIEPKAGAGHVTLTAVRTGNQLVVGVEDDGQGLQAGGSAGIGLANIRDQLRARFGDRARLSIGPRAGGGVAATIALPVEPGEK
jgi:signal transduction histidine kinase